MAPRHVLAGGGGACRRGPASPAGDAGRSCRLPQAPEGHCPVLEGWRVGRNGCPGLASLPIAEDLFSGARELAGWAGGAGLEAGWIWLPDPVQPFHSLTSEPVSSIVSLGLQPHQMRGKDENPQEAGLPSSKAGRALEVGADRSSASLSTAV